MRFKDLVANSLPRVRGRKNKKTAYAHAQPHVSANQEPEFSTCPRYYPQHPVLDSRESSVERSSTVAVVDVPWRENAVYKSRGNRTRHDDLGLVAQPMPYYAPPPPPRHGMVMSHSADGISSQSTMALLMTSSRGYVNGSKVTTISDHYAAGDYQHHNMSAISESAVNYIGPNCFYHSQYQHQHHHHHHSHDHHYVYHHHHHRQNQPQAQVIKPTPLAEKTPQQQVCNASNTQPPPTGGEKPRKSESGGFFRKSFASFRAMRKQGSRNKEQGSRNKEQDTRQNLPSDENEKCMVCPYPQAQNNDNNGSERKPLKQSRKGLKSLTKSKKKKDASHDRHSDASGYSDNDTKKHHQGHVYNLDSAPYTAPQKFPILECSMESSIPRHQPAGSREGSYVREVDNSQHLETASLSGYDSDVAKNRSGRSRSRIKTNPWLPSLQPSLAMGRRFENCHFRESHEDVMDEDNMSFFPRSASFDIHSQLGLSSFQTPACGQDESRRSIQRHRSLTPVDLKLNFSLPKPKPIEPTKSSNRTEPSQEQGTTEVDKTHLNDLNTKLTKSRPNSIVSPNSEFIALADNIEQLANNISFEYEDMFDASLENETGLPRDNGNPKGSRRTMEENNPKRRKSESNPFPDDIISDNAHSPDSGIGCLGSCDGDDVMTNSLILEQSPIITSPPEILKRSPLDFNSSEKFHKTAGQNSTSCQNGTKRNETMETKHGSNSETKNRFSLNNCETSPSGHHSVRLHASSSNESLNSAVISESDIDNTSYKYTDNLVSSSLMADSSKPLNSTGSLMVEERLDINFRSLPRKGAGNRTKKSGHKEVCRSHTIGRMKNVPMENECTSSLMPLSDNSLPNGNSETVCKLKNKQSSFAAKQRKHDLRFSADNEQCGEIEFRSGNFGCLSEEGQCSNDFFLTNNESAATFTDIAKPLVVKLDGKQSRDAKDGNDVTMKGYEIDSQEMIGKHQQPLGFRTDNMETRQFVQMDTAVYKETPVSNTSVDVCLDTVDVSVQTDFYDFDSWERRQTSPLPDLDDSFDPVESTRRWLLSGNMQGSADTGYSSQPRDSHVFMEEEAALLQFDALCDKGVQPKARGETSIQKGRRSVDGESPLHESPLHVIYYANEIYGLPNLSAENDVMWTPPTLNTLGPLTGSNDLLDPPIRKPSVDNSDINKRHSSDSSTSTLTSDMPELDVENSPDPKCNAIRDVCGQQVLASFVTKNEKPEPDYVNLPPQSTCNKHRSNDRNGLLSRGKNETQRKCTKCLCLHTSVDSPDNKLKLKDGVPEKDFQNRHMNSFRCSENVSNFDEDGADYLEFLKDAPLQNSYRRNPVFIIPGFGPVEFPSGHFETSANFDDFYPHEENIGNANVCERFDRLTRPDGSTHGKKGYTKDPGSQSKNNKSPKVKKEERVSVPMSLPCVVSMANSTLQSGQNDDTRGEKMKSCHTSSGKRKPHLSKDLRTDRCPTMRSYDVDNFPPISNGPNYSSYPGQCSDSPLLPDKSATSMKDNSTRNLAERVSLLRREKEIIYRKIQECQQQELSKQREQLQQQRHLHSQRKDELLETLHDLKEKLEEQSKMLQMRCGEEI